MTTCRSGAPRCGSASCLQAWSWPCALGVIHAGFSLYWATGGSGCSLRWLRSSCLRPWAHRCSIDRGGRRGVTRSACWLGAVLLVVWGGLNTVVDNLVLAGAIEPGPGYERPGMIGHLFMWDPLFLAWGAALTIGLLASRDRVARRD